VILVQKLAQQPHVPTRHSHLSFFYRLLADLESREINNHPAYAHCLIHCRQFYYLFNSVIQHIIDENLLGIYYYFSFCFFLSFFLSFFLQYYYVIGVFVSYPFCSLFSLREPWKRFVGQHFIDITRIEE
jgi:hypothetical protein